RTGAEALALAAEDDGPRVADVGERLAQRLDQRRVERVPPPGTCQRDGDDVSVAEDAQRRRRGGHVAARLGCSSGGSLARSALTSRSTSASSCPKSSR